MLTTPTDNYTAACERIARIAERAARAYTRSG